MDASPAHHAKSAINSIFAKTLEEGDLIIGSFDIDLDLIIFKIR